MMQRLHSMSRKELTNLSTVVMCGYLAVPWIKPKLASRARGILAALHISLGSVQVRVRALLLSLLMAVSLRVSKLQKLLAAPAP